MAVGDLDTMAPAQRDLLWSTPAGALSLRLLLPWALGLTALAFGFRCVTGSVSAGFLAAVTWFVLLLGQAWVSAWSSRSVRSRARLPLRQHLAIVLKSMPCALMVQLTWLGIWAGIVLLAALGLTLIWIPGWGETLFLIWLYSAGAVLCFLAAVVSLLGMVSSSLVVPFTVIEHRNTVAAFTTCLSYVRRRPLKYFWALLVVLCSTTLALVPFAAVATLAAMLLGLLYLVGTRPVPTPAAYLSELGEILRSGGSGTAQETYWILAAFSVWIAAFCVVSFQVGLTRIFLILRRDIDGVSVLRIPQDEDDQIEYRISNKELRTSK